MKFSKQSEINQNYVNSRHLLPVLSSLFIYFLFLFYFYLFIFFFFFFWCLNCFIFYLAVKSMQSMHITEE